MHTFNHRARLTAYLCALSLISSIAGAQSFNVDFADINDRTDQLSIRFIDGGTVMPGPPSPTFGAAANQPGVWNLIVGAGPTTLNDLGGFASAAQITLTASSFTGYGGGHSGDLLRLLDDNFYSVNNTSWSF